MSVRRYAVIAGGGTAGHVFVALATARALADRGVERNDIELIGSARGQEGRLANGEGFGLTLLPGRGIARQLRAGPQLTNLVSVGGLLWATLRGLVMAQMLSPRPVDSSGERSLLVDLITGLLDGVPA